ncbi:MAG: peptidoglycan editing factor PgeF [Motiliproteus sp.]
MATSGPQLITPDWPAPDNVAAYATTRDGGVSEAPFDGFNLGDHVDDQPQAVVANRQLLQQALTGSVRCQWLQQVHGIEVARLQSAGAVIEADAAATARTNVACLVMTADCLPVLFCDRQGHHVAAAHAGWRGLCGGVLEATIKAMTVPADQIMCWLGPAIGPAAFEVGDEVRQAFCQQQPEAAQAFHPVTAAQAFASCDPTGPQKWLADIYQLARLRLQRAGVSVIYGGDFCTFTDRISTSHDQPRFFSYRRDGRTGRMASLVWLRN